MTSIFTWLDKNRNTKKGLILNQLVPIVTVLVLFIFFVTTSHIYITHFINPTLQNPIHTSFRLQDVLAGFFLYFITAIDYALIVGRMSTINTGAKARFVMNVGTVLGCYIGVTGVLFLWGFGKEITWFIIPVMIFAGSVMIKLAYEGTEYFLDASIIPKFIRILVVKFTDLLYFITRPFTFWMPEIGKPSTKKMSAGHLFKWSLVLPFIIGLDDLIGYMGAMTIYNVFGFLIGIYIADVLIDVLIFLSPELTKKLVQNAVLSLFATIAFLYLAYKSFSESFMSLHDHYHLTGRQIFWEIFIFIIIVVVADFIMAKVQHRKHYLSGFTDLRIDK